jgi:steroid 5-alpha reductase family enzyme
MSPFGLTLSVNLAALVVLMTALWAVSVYVRDASIIDPCWGVGFVLVAWLSRAWNANAEAEWRSLLLAVLTTVWGVRLSWFLLQRNFGHGEDRRYAAMREHWGARFWWVSLATVFLLQAVVLWFVAWPVQATAASKSSPPAGWLDGLGLTIWTIGFLFEAIGDWQLNRFKADPANAGRVLDRGLWRYTRHPNYFGDCCVWWGIYLIAAASGAWWTMASPLLMTLLLLKVSGVSLLERTIVDRRPEYARYQARTSPFFPWPPSPAVHDAAQESR